MPSLTITLTGPSLHEDTISLFGITFKAVPDAPGKYEWQLGVDAATSAFNLGASINAAGIGVTATVAGAVITLEIQVPILTDFLHTVQSLADSILVAQPAR